MVFACGFSLLSSSILILNTVNCLSAFFFQLKYNYKRLRVMILVGSFGLAWGVYYRCDVYFKNRLSSYLKSAECKIRKSSKHLTVRSVRSGDNGNCVVKTFSVQSLFLVNQPKDASIRKRHCLILGKRHQKHSQK